MSLPPERPRLYHITHVDNLRQIVAASGLWSDRRVLEQGGPARTIGMSKIKRRRLEEIVVKPHPDTRVGDYVPFYFGPRSVMLFIIHRANHPELDYRGGQEPIVHLEVDARAAIQWATSSRRRWAFTLSNAGSFIAEFRSRVEELDQIDWAAVAANDFRDRLVQERKQAEFLLEGDVPFELVRCIGVISPVIQAQALASLAGSAHRPPVEVRREWYF